MRINVLVTVPSVEKSFDLSVPDSLPIEQITSLIAKGVEDMTNASYKSSGAEFLCISACELPLDPKRTLHSYGIESGDRLYLL
jgi:uncharacterized ubiquitin-like protein YukD